MNEKLPRRTFLLSWLGGLLAGRLGHSQAQAAAAPPPRQIVPNSNSCRVIVSVSDGATVEAHLFNWNVNSAIKIRP